jgi:hypothetical protein
VVPFLHNDCVQYHSPLLLHERELFLLVCSYTHIFHCFAFIFHYDHVDPICEVSSIFVVFLVLILLMVFDDA